LRLCRRTTHSLPLQKKAELAPALRAALDRVEAEWLVRAKQGAENDGTCVAVVVVDGEKLVAASIGDSEMVLSRGGRAVPLCQVHNPSRNQAEADRVEAAGGVMDPKRKRIIDPSNLHSLALSRTVGDICYKESETGVIAEPDIQEYTLQRNDELVIIGCDGVWDVVQHQEAVNLCHALIQSGASPHDAAKRLVELSLEKGSTDNISAIIVVLEKHAADCPSVHG